MKKIEIRKFAVASLLASLATVLLILGGLFEVIDLTVSAIASMTVVIAVIELKGKYPFFVYLTASILSIILLPMRSASLYFACFLGFYPILKSSLIRVNKIISWIIKLSAFNTCSVILYFILKTVSGIPGVSWYYLAGLLFFANVFFVAYDFALSGLITLYIIKIRKMLKLHDLFK